MPCAPDADNPASMVLISPIGDQKSDSTTISASADGTNDGGRLRRAASSCSIACAILSITLRLAVGIHQAGNADAFAARDQQFGERERHDQRAFQLAVARLLWRQTPSTASGPATATPYARPPIPAREHRDDRRAPSAASRRSATARRKRSGGIARSFRRRRRAAVHAGRESRWRRCGELQARGAAAMRRAFGFRHRHVGLL